MLGSPGTRGRVCKRVWCNRLDVRLGPCDAVLGRRHTLTRYSSAILQLACGAKLVGSVCNMSKSSTCLEQGCAYYAATYSLAPANARAAAFVITLPTPNSHTWPSTYYPIMQALSLPLAATRSSNAPSQVTRRSPLERRSDRRLLCL